MRYLILITFLMYLGCKEKSEKESTYMNGPSKVELVQTDGSYSLLVDGEPYIIKGAGLEFGSIPELAEHGGNTFRTWRIENGQRSPIEVLDEADSLGIKVVMGIEVARERHGFDYNDTAAVRAQLEQIRNDVMAIKDHPALLMWGIGNELNLRATNPKVWDAVNEISLMLHEIDTFHLTTTSLAGINPELVADIKQRAPDLDLLSVQFYADVVNLPRYIDECNWTGAYMITEWGATGHWEVGTTAWGAPVENNSTQKARYYMERYQDAIAPEADQCIGSFVFLWGQKQERTPTWYGVYLEDGSETEAVDVMHKIWKGNWPANRSPSVDSVVLDNRGAFDNIYLQPGQMVEARAFISDPDNDEITYNWVVMYESTDLGDGGDFESTPPVLDGLVTENGHSSAEMKAPQMEGAYRLFMYAYDGNGHAAHANIPFFVKQ
jgi:hypothetical protein